MSRSPAAERPSELKVKVEPSTTPHLYRPKRTPKQGYNAILLPRRLRLRFNRPMLFALEEAKRCGRFVGKMVRPPE